MSYDLKHSASKGMCTEKCYCIYPKYWDTLSTYHTAPKILNSPFYYLLMCLKYMYCCMYDKQCRPWSDAAFCSIWSGSSLFTRACLSQYLGLLYYVMATHLKCHSEALWHTNVYQLLSGPMEYSFYLEVRSIYCQRFIIYACELIS